MTEQLTGDFTSIGMALGKLLLAKGLSLATAESCTGGGIATSLTNIPGASQWFERGFVTYSNEAKKEMLHIPSIIIERHGAVSAETVCAMAQGALVYSHATVSIAVSGVAGPTGGSDNKPVGTVFFAFTGKAFNTEITKKLFKGDRVQIRQQCIEFSLSHLQKLLS